MTTEKPKPEYQKLTVQGTTYETTLTTKYRRRKPWVQFDPRKILCVIPGVILKVLVRQGQIVRQGDPLVVLEAMKMQNEILSPADGTVKTVAVSPGTQVGKGQMLVELA
jgi:biotin carboxyl carrier protein